MSLPTTITGGCSCGGIRYRIDFSQDHDWQHAPHTCQCTQCRKNCGSLIYHFHSVSPSELTWTSRSTYAEYNSSPECYRSFCKVCGSTIGWRDDKEIELAVGAFDEQFLIGERNAEGVPVGGYGLALANPEADHFYLENAVSGVTDSLKGTHFLKGSKDGPMVKKRND